VATKGDFTDEEWERLRRGVTGAGLLVSMSDRGFFDSFREAGALARHMAQAREGASSALVRELAGERGTGFALGDRPDEIQRETIESLRSAVATLEQKAPDEVDDYRAFVLEVARSVAAASGGGDEAEGGTVDEIRAALGT
jgi:hypothetical protein